MMGVDVRGEEDMKLMVLYVPLPPPTTGLMFTAAMVYWTLHFFNLTVDIRNVCVLLAPWMASNTAIATYLLGKEVKNSSAGLVAAAFISVVPGYISRSVAGSYDNEGVAIFALILTFYLWVKAVKTVSSMSF
jgi:dolichyl-diphosphooligosaccharide--protein glycosyltransferase